jgi:hypothetical protein
MPSRPPKAKDSPAYRWAMIILGWAIMLSAPVVGILPGPGGLILFPLGLGIVLKNSIWAKRQFSKQTKRHPEYGHWFNWAMRRKRFKERPPLPPMKRDFLNLFRRDDNGRPPA